MPHLFLGKFQQIDAVQDDLARGDATGVLNQAQQPQDGRRFAAARLSDEPEPLSRVEREVQLIHGPNNTPAGLELDVQSSDLHQSAVFPKPSSDRLALLGISQFVEAGGDHDQADEQERQKEDGDGPPPPQAPNEGVESDGPVDRHAHGGLVLRTQTEGLEADRGEDRPGNGASQVGRQVGRMLGNSSFQMISIVFMPLSFAMCT